MNHLLEQPLSSQEKEQLACLEYDFFPQKIEQIGNVKKITCNLGVFALKKSSVSEDQLEFIHQTLEKLKKGNYPHILSFCKNKYGDAYVTIQGDSYYVVPWVEDKVEEKYKVQWEMSILKGLGQLHAISENLEGLTFSSPSLSSDVLLERWEKRLEKLDEYKEFIKSRNVMSPFETTFLSHFNYLRELALRAIRYLKAWKEREKERPMTRMVLCHGQISRKHVVQTEDQYYFIDFEHASGDSPARDLALFLRRHMDKLLNEEVAIRWLQAYEEEFPLRKEEKVLLAIYLLFPEQVFKEIDLYYQGAREWHPLKKAKYLEKQIKNTYLMRKFIKQLMSEG
jgi:spore coat protein YsxE